MPNNIWEKEKGEGTTASRKEEEEEERRGGGGGELRCPDLINGVIGGGKMIYIA